MSDSEGSAVTYTSVYTDSEPGRAFWGADDEEPLRIHTPRPVPQDEDEREPMFVQGNMISDTHSSGVSPTAEVSPRYVWSILEEDPEEYEDDETEDGPIDYPMDGEDDDDGDSSRDDADGEDEDDEDEDDEDEEEEEEEHLAPADSAILVSVDEPVFPPEGIEPVIPPPSTDITIGARITCSASGFLFRSTCRQVERLLAMTTPSPSPPVSLSPPSAGERLIRSMAPPAHLSPPPVPSPLLPSSGCPTQIPKHSGYHPLGLIVGSYCRITHTLTYTTPPSLYIHHLLIIEMIFLRGDGKIMDFVSTVDAEERRQGIRDVGVLSQILGVLELAGSMALITSDLYALLEDAQDSRSRISQRVDMDSQRVTHQELQTHRDHVYAHETHLQAHQTQLQLQGTLIQTQHQVHETRFQMQQAELAALRETDPFWLHCLRSSRRRARQPGPDVRIPDHQDASGDADSHI
ncbi:hypothetical protein Tco_0688913 [Tanacetum coccineum]